MSAYDAYERGEKIAEIFRHRQYWRVYWPSRPAVEDFRTLAGARACVSQAFEPHGRRVEFRRMSKPRRYVVQDAQKGVDTGLRVIRERWKVIDATTNRIVDEYASGRAARSAAAYYNEHGVTNQ